MSELGKRIRELRKEKKLTQEQLGKILNVSHSTINRYESGLHQPDIESLNILANTFNCTTDYLLGRTDMKEVVIMEGEEIPEELRAVGIDYMEVDKIAKEQGFTPEDIKEILETVGKIQKKNNNQ